MKGFNLPAALLGQLLAVFLFALFAIPRADSATYDFNATLNTLAISLATNESLTNSVSGSDVVFNLSSGTFTQTGPNTAPGDGTGTLSVPGADLATSLTVNNTGAGAGTNDVTFAGGGTITSATILVNPAAANTVCTIAFATANTTFAATTTSLIASKNVVVNSGITLQNSSGTLLIEANPEPFFKIVEHILTEHHSNRDDLSYNEKHLQTLAIGLFSPYDAYYIHS